MITPDRIEEPFSCASFEMDGRELWTPTLEITFSAGSIVLHHFNTRVRQFANESADHLEVRVNQELKGILVNQELLQQFVDYEYPRRWDPYVDEATMDWLTATASLSIDEELRDFPNT